MTVKKKKISDSDIIGEKGIALIHRVVLDMGCLWHPTGGVEAGIDGFIEVRDPATGETTNSIVQIQSKARARPFTAETAEGFEYLCDERDLEYWLNGNAPVILVISRPDDGEAYWVSIKDRFKDLKARRERKVFFDKKRDRFDATARAAVVELAIPRDKGVYLAPPPKREMLYTNLLGVSRLAPDLYVAKTDIRFPGEVWEALRDATVRPRGEWVLVDKRLFSFHDLSQRSWDTLCDRGTVKRHDTDDFAYSLDDDQRYIFVRLLNHSLAEKLYEHGIRFDRDFRHYYFKATQNLEPREITYQSLEKKVPRTVLSPYKKKGDPSQVVYYRHNAFEGSFKQIEEGWYLEITPTYRYTSDGYSIYRFYEDQLKGIKRLEDNPAVLGQVVMWASILKQPRDMFDAADPFLEFGELKTFELDAGLYDEHWLKNEEKEEEIAGSHDQQTPLFKT
jgi:hypothetical protein